MRLIISEQLQSELVHHAQIGYPQEVCGLLAGQGEHIKRVIPIDNHAPDKQRGFLITHHDLNIHLPQIRAEGLSLIGFYHSHPNTPPIPSPTDMRDLDNGLQLPHAIISISHRQAYIQAWIVSNGRADPVEWVVGEATTMSHTPVVNATQRYAFLLSVFVSLVLLLIVALTLLPPAPPLS